MGTSRVGSVRGAHGTTLGLRGTRPRQEWGLSGLDQRESFRFHAELTNSRQGQDQTLLSTPRKSGGVDSKSETWPLVIICTTQRGDPGCLARELHGVSILLALSQAFDPAALSRLEPAVSRQPALLLQTWRASLGLARRVCAALTLNTGRAGALFTVLTPKNLISNLITLSGGTKNVNEKIL